MFANFKNTQILILGITSILFSRAMFAFFNDPEGPNLLIVVGTALILYSLSLAIYLFSFEKNNIVFNASMANYKKLLIAIFFQIITAAVFYFILTNY